MGHFQLINGTRLVVNPVVDLAGLFVGMDIPNIGIHIGNTVRLKNVGWPNSAGNDMPTITTARPSVVEISVPRKAGNEQTFTVKALGAGTAIIKSSFKGDITLPLKVWTGSFEKHRGMEIDLLAKVCRGSDPVKTHAIYRLLFNDPDNKFNELSDANVQRWGELACGTVAKVGGRDLINSGTDYTYKDYHKPIKRQTDVGGNPLPIDRNDVKYDDNTIKRGQQSIKKRLERGMPVVVGLTYIPDSALGASGSLRPTGLGGHSVLIVGCNAAASEFLYVDLWHGGSTLRYEGGFAGHKFPVCKQLGVFVAKYDAVRGSTVLRQRPDTQGPGEVFEGNQFLEVVSGPLD